MRSITAFGLYGGQTSREKQRADAKMAGTLKAGTYGLGVVQPQRKRDQQRMAKLHPLRDDCGAYTLTGGRDLQRYIDGVTPRGRRVWVAGISAKRGY